MIWKTYTLNNLIDALKNNMNKEKIKMI